MQVLRANGLSDCLVWSALERAMAVEPSIMGSRATADNLERVYRDRHALLLWDDGRAVGFIAAWNTPTGNLEIGATWVDSAYRGQGLGNLLAREIVMLIGEIRGARGFAITTNPRFVAAALRAGMRLHGDWRDPIAWEATCGPCDAIAENEKAACPKRNAACRLLFCPDSD